MKQLKMLWLIVAMGLVVAFGSCRKDERPEPQETPAQIAGDSITLNLSAEIGFEEDEGDLKGLSFKLEDVNGKKIPRPQFTDNKEVEVHTIVKSSTGAYGIKTLKWKYDPDKKKLVLKQDDPNNLIDVPNFNNNGGVKWYISGLLASGTALGGAGKQRSCFRVHESYVALAVTQVMLSEN